LDHARAAIHHVCGFSFDSMRVFVQVNVDCSSGERLCHFAHSDQKLSDRLSALIDVAAIFGSGRVSRKFHASHASTVVLPGPRLASIAMR